MAKRTILVSDISGQEINDKNGAKVTITYADTRRGAIVVDAIADEVGSLAAYGVRQKRRGRKPTHNGS